MEKETLKGSCREAILKARCLSMKTTSPNRGKRREVSIYIGDYYLKGIG